MRIAQALACFALALAPAVPGSLSAAPATVPTKLSYQGYLTSGGVPVNATVNMTLKLYDHPTAGSLVWSETQSVAVTNGVYAVVLGNTNPVDRIVLDGPRYLTVAVESDGDMLPRTPLASAPYAILASALEGTLPVPGGGTGTTALTENGVLYGNGTGSVGATGAGSVGQILTATAGGVPQWSNSSSPNLLISHPGPGSLSIQSAGLGVSIQGVAFNFGSVDLPAGTSLAVDGNQVVRERQAGVANAVNATGIDVNDPGPAQVVTLAEFNALVARFNELADRMRAHGLIAP